MIAARTAWLLAGLAVLGAAARPANEGSEAGFATIREDDLALHLQVLASEPLEGRDSPSLGLERAARYLAARFAECGLEPLGEDFLLPFEMSAPAPVPAGCQLELRVEGEEARAFELGRDFVPVAGFDGAGEGELVFLGFGIDASKERFAEIPKRLDGEVAMILEGEPRHRRRFDGEEVTRHAALWTKLAQIARADAAGVIVVRRARQGEDGLPPEARGEEGGADVSFRHAWATWEGEQRAPRPRGRELPPVVEVDAECAALLLGADVEELARASDKNGRPPRHKRSSRAERRVSLRASSATAQVQVHNVVGVLPGSDPALAGEFVVLGAHYDHVGVDERGRIGLGADDNGSGTSALLELAQAFAAAPPRRSLVFCAFAAEEHGLLGSRAFCERPPLALGNVVAMLNMDMLGRGDRDEIAVLGLEQNPELEDVLGRARKLARTGVKKLVLRQGQELWERSDHFEFHRKGVPALFFFEGLPISRNPDYHTWRDTVDKLDLDKIARSTRFIYNTAWLLATDDDRPPGPRD